MYLWSIREESLHEIGIGLRLKRDIKYPLIPTLYRPPHTLTKIINSTPIGESDDLITIHLEEIRSHGCHTRLTLVECLFWISAAITGEIHIAVVVGVDLGSYGKVGGNGVCINIAVARMHGDCRQTAVVITAEQFTLQLIGRHTPIVERQV